MRALLIGLTLVVSYASASAQAPSRGESGSRARTKRAAVLTADSAASALKRFADSEDGSDLSEAIRLAGASAALFSMLDGHLPKDLADLRDVVQSIALRLGPHFISVLSDNSGQLGSDQPGLVTAAAILSAETEDAVKKYAS